MSIFEIEEMKQEDRTNKIEKWGTIKLNLPFMVAASSAYRTLKLEQELKECGFNTFLETPITSDKINCLL